MADSHVQSKQPTTASVCDCPRIHWAFKILVLAQFATVALTVCFLESAFDTYFTGAISLLGVCIGIWAIVKMEKSFNVSPRLKANAKLKEDGPYRFVRHPMYSALLLFCGGFVLADRSLYGIGLWLFLTIILVCKIRFEEQMLYERFEAYSDYANRTKRFVPFLI